MRSTRGSRCGLLLALAALAVVDTGKAAAQTIDDTIAEIRDAAVKDFDREKIAAGYGTLISFAVNPHISAARFYPDEGEGIYDVELKASRIPYRYVFDSDGDGPTPFVQGVLAYQTLDAGFTVTPDDVIEGRWRTVGGALTGGMIVPVGEHLDLLAGVNVGVGRIDNEAVYRGPIATQILEPALRELVFDWSTDAMVYGLVVGADYRGNIGGRRFQLDGSITHHWLESFNESNEFVAFNSTATAADLKYTMTLMPDFSIGQYPVTTVGLLGATTFIGPQRDALGFTEFFEAGLALEADISKHGWGIRSLRFGLKAIVGPDVTGWSLIVGRGFD